MNFSFQSAVGQRNYPSYQKRRVPSESSLSLCLQKRHNVRPQPHQPHRSFSAPSSPPVKLPWRVDTLERAVRQPWSILLLRALHALYCTW